jgi:hypothetical protein
MAKKRGRNVRRGQYRYTQKRAVALRRAQAISARKRKGRRNSAIKGAIVGATIAGVGAAAIYGYKNRSSIQATSVRWKAAVQPGSKERVRLANAIGGNLIKKPTKKTAATKGAKTMTRIDLGKVNPNIVDPSRNNAFPRQQRDVEVTNKLISGSDRPYNVDKFLPKGVKGLVYGKRVTGNAASRAVDAHAQAKGKITGEDVDASGILHSMIADGSVTRVYAGKKLKGKKPPIKPVNSRAGVTRKGQPKQTLEAKALEQWIKDFGE